MKEEAIREEISKRLFDIIVGNDAAKPAGDRKTFGDHVTEQIEQRDGAYTELLQHFVKVTRIRNYLKEFFKWTFYLTIVCSIIALISVFCSLFSFFIKSATVEQMIEALPLFVTALVSFVSVIIAIPLAITKYLFSTNEDKNITDIILHTQEHDTSGRQWFLDFKNTAKNKEKLLEEDIIEVS